MSMSRADISLLTLAYNLCEERNLPVLVTDLIASYLDKRDAVIISRLSRRLNRDAIRVIYNDIVLEPDTLPFGPTLNVSASRAALLLRTLLTNSSAAASVEKISLAGEPLHEWRSRFALLGESIENRYRGIRPQRRYTAISAYTGEELEACEKTCQKSSKQLSRHGIELPRLCIALLRLTFRIRSLAVSSDYFRWPYFRDSTKEIVNAGHFSKLESCMFALDLLEGQRKHVGVVQDWDNVLISPLLVSSVKHVATVATLAPGTRFPLCCALIRLELHHYQAQELDLGAFLATMPQLRELSYHALSHFAWFTLQRRKGSSAQRDSGLDCLFNALHFAPSLEELHTTQILTEDSIHFYQEHGQGLKPPYKPPYELAQLARLHTLTIPYASLLGWTSKPDEKFEWSRTFPASLRRITLTDHLVENFDSDSWTDETLIPVITDMLDWLATRGTGKKPLKLGLRLMHADCEFNEPKRDELSRLCEERGIRCSIEKLHEDCVDVRQSFMRTRGRGRGRGLGRARGRGGMG